MKDNACMNLLTWFVLRLKLKQSKTSDPSNKRTPLNKQTVPYWPEHLTVWVVQSMVPIRMTRINFRVRWLHWYREGFGWNLRGVNMRYWALSTRIIGKSALIVSRYNTSNIFVYAEYGHTIHTSSWITGIYFGSQRRLNWSQGSFHYFTNCCGIEQVIQNLKLFTNL